MEKRSENIKLFINQLIEEVDKEGKQNWLERVISYAYKIIQVGEYNHELYQNIKDGNEKFDLYRDLETFATEHKGLCGTFVEIFLLTCFQDEYIKNFMPYLNEIYCNYGKDEVPHAILMIDIDGGKYIDFSSIIHLAKDKPCAFKGDIKNYFFVDYNTIVDEFNKSGRQLNIVNEDKNANFSPYFAVIKHYEDALNYSSCKDLSYNDYLNSIIKDNKDLPKGGVVLSNKHGQLSL